MSWKLLFKMVFFSNKGQTGVVTAVIMAGIIISGVTAALTWGLPLLEKEQDVREVEETVDMMLELADEIETVAERGGSRTFDVDFERGSLVFDEEANSIDFAVTTNAAFVTTSEWVPLNARDVRGIDIVGEGDSYGVAGRDRAGVVLGITDLRGEEYNTRLMIDFRELNDLETDRGYQIDLSVSGEDVLSSGSHTFYVEYEGEEVDGSSKRGGPLEKQTVSITVG